jgi:hypothetical protein
MEAFDAIFEGKLCPEPVLSVHFLTKLRGLFQLLK